MLMVTVNNKMHDLKLVMLVNSKTNAGFDLPVVTRADLIAAGDQFPCTDLSRAAIPATWGQAIEVPDRSANPSL